MCDSKQKSSYEHGSDFGRLRSYGHLLIPYMPSCELRLTEPAGGLRTQLGSLSFALQALCVSRDSRSSQPGGSLFCGRRWHFRKPALSTDQFKLKVISRSQLYIYTLNVSCIMLVYYFVPFIVNNRYLLF